MEKLPKLRLPLIILIIVVVIFISKSYINIPYGEAGVVWKRFGGGTVVDEPPLGEGFRFIAPWNRVYTYNICFYTYNLNDIIVATIPLTTP